MAKIIFENIDENDIQHEDTILLILKKMIAIQDNLEVINKDLFDTTEVEIVVNLSEQEDEFLVDAEPYNKDGFRTNIEVVAENIGIDNELEILKMSKEYTSEDIKTYKIASCLSLYKKLGTSEFYFREL